jgi:hypothetical protein
MKNKKQTTTTKSTNTKKTTSSNKSTSSGAKTNISKKENDKSKDKINTTKNKTPTPQKIESKKEKIIIDFQEIVKPSLITTNENVNFNLYLELMSNLDKKDDLKTLAICRLILSQDPNNTKVKELHDIIYDSIKENYYESGELEPSKEEKMDKHMKLNKDGEYEYCFSDESEDEK